MHSLAQVILHLADCWIRHRLYEIKPIRLFSLSTVLRERFGHSRALLAELKRSLSKVF